MPTQPPVSFPLSKGQFTGNVTSWVDTANQIHAGLPPGYNTPPTWAADDGGALVSLAVAGFGCTATMQGVAGSLNLTATITAPGLPTLTTTQPVTLSGPSPAGVVITIS
jgi:hypothetical protein